MRVSDIFVKMQNILRYGEKPIEFQLETDGEFYYLASDVSIHFNSLCISCRLRLLAWSYSWRQFV